MFASRREDPARTGDLYIPNVAFWPTELLPYKFRIGNPKILDWSMWPSRFLLGGPDEIRTHNSLNANQVLYQLELRAQINIESVLLRQMLFPVYYAFTGDTVLFHP